jgi:hypothetical protein
MVSKRTDYWTASRSVREDLVHFRFFLFFFVIPFISIWLFPVNTPDPDFETQIRISISPGLRRLCQRTTTRKMRSPAKPGHLPGTLVN